ncbi:hypothetical protein FN846DRAFT_917035 [Sphaerosporella brunnea]|uniref:FAD-binding domain-containing protein n=1 Tax=Sphaerosporella brunnea TaxID=1250544 RepID=A0A5J5F4U2_9PEZI|nr:hypothetical protein FN846DRAFT_917035 [Sphaerosporella brunnea]
MSSAPSIATIGAGPGGLTLARLLHVNALMNQRNGDGTIRSYALEKLIAGYYADWDESLKDLIRLCDDHMIPRKPWMLPVGIRWAPRPGVTLVGDAAYAMGPFAGVGVHLAMEDALELTAALVARQNDLTEPVALAADLEEYEMPVFIRAQKNAQKTGRGFSPQMRPRNTWSS